MGVSDNDTSNSDPDNSGPAKNSGSKQNPVRLTIGNYYCSNCGEGGLSRGDPQCLRCQYDLLWARVDV